MKEKIQELLGNGVSPAAAALAVGCEQSYITELLKDDTFAGAVAARKVDLLQSATLRDERYNSLEDTLLNKLEENIDLFMNPDKILSALERVNKMVRRGAGVPTEQTLNIRDSLVSIVLPKVLVQNIQINNENQVVSVQGKTMATIGAKNLLARIAEADSRKALEGEQDDNHKVKNAPEPITAEMF